MRLGSDRKNADCDVLRLPDSLHESMPRSLVGISHSLEGPLDFSFLSQFVCYEVGRQSE